jgi:nitrate/TMAO reductase-like tetraheme cytochrome c subunit
MTDQITPQSPQELPPAEASAPPKRRRRRWLWVLGALGILFVLWLFFILSVELLHYTESAAFCSSCHIMHPENTAYENSPHARAECGTCHVGPGALAAFQAKLANLRYLWTYPTGQYEKPIPSPITSLRPVEVVCEQCHWPEMFYEDRMAVIPDYATDEQNSLTNTALLMKTRGGTDEAGLGRGIHWHIANPVYYIATDDKRQEIPWVQAEYDGKVTEYISVDSTLTQADIDNAEKRKMDCVDCHNRASHDFRRPNDSIDEAMAAGLIADDLPFIKQQGVEVLEAAYTTEEEAAAAIAGVADFYQQNYPDIYTTRQADVEQAVAQLQSIFDRTTFPFMNLDWQSHTNNVGHKDFPGCFRCHDGKHLSQDNEAIRLECNICHAIPQVALPGQDIPTVNAWPPANEPDTHRSTTWLAEHRYQFNSTCAECHTVSDPGGTSNTSFCSNSACHGTEWVYADLNAPAISALVAPPREPGTGEPNPVPHPITADTNCLTCHGASGVIPAPESHAGFDIGMCTQCHQAPQTEDTAPAEATPAPETGATPEASATAQPSEEPAAGGPPAIPHPLEGREGCVLCHGESGVKPFPADHTGRTNDVCQMCHKPAPAESATPAAAASPAATAAPPAGAAPQIPHAIEGQQNQCLACHYTTSIEPFPADHEGFSNDLCLSCHTLEN